MASSGYSSFTLYRDAIIGIALRKLRVIQDGQIPNAIDINSGNQALNMLMKNWQVQGLILSLYQQIAVPMVQGQSVYTIGPVSADLVIQRPVQVLDGSFYRRTVSSVVTDTPLKLLSRQAYEQISTKSVQGSPNSIFYAPTIDIAVAAPLYPTSPSIGWGTLYIYYNPINSTDVVYINTRRAVQDVIDGGDEVDLPQEWFMPLVWGLAAQLADEYEVPEDRCNRLFKWAEYYRKQLQDWQHELADVNFAERRQQEERVMDNKEPA